MSDQPTSPKPTVVHRKKRGKYRHKDPLLQSPRTLARIETMNRNRVVEVTLAMQHTRSGKVYGPGVTRIPRGLALELQREEEHATRVEERFLGTKAAIIVSERGKVREVPSETFDTSLANAEPAFAQKGKL